jgi:hypothetical protein
MRTTVTLDPDVEQALRSAMRERGLSFKEALNEAIRTGLMGRTKQNTHGFSQPTFRLGREQNFRWDKALAAADALEDEELTRKLSIRK